MNRLDKDTTGLLILAKNMYSASLLSTMIKNREVHREYLAIATGFVRCMNRLDKDTTGLLILAKNMYSASLLSTMIKNREVHREYLAIATGFVPYQGIIDKPIGRVDGSTIEREVNLITGDPARTHFKRLAYKNGYSLVSLKLETGRTHQIRVHMKSIGHPLPGDFLYNPDYSIIQRQALHSYRLSFAHPITKEPLVFTAPLPEDMRLLFPLDH